MLSLDKNHDAVVRFGPFELDPENGELRKHGRPIRLSPQPFKVLSVLVSRQGKLVSREELHHEIWNGTTFVDFEQGLNFCVRRIRAVLDDDAEKPRFIETLPRRGYRFIAPVEPATEFTAARTPPRDGNGHLSSSFPIGQARPQPNSRTRLTWIGVLSAAAAICVVLLVSRRQGLESTPTVVRVSAITNDGRQKLTNTPSFPAPMISDGSRVYFQESLSAHSAIAQVAISGGETELLSTPFRDVQLAAISSDHSTILLGDVRSESDMELPFYTLPVIGGTAKRLGNFLAHDAAWSPDGNRLVYAKNDELDLSNNDGASPRKLVGGIGIPWWPRWSPDGSRIRFTATNSRTQSSALWEVGSDGTHLHRLLTGWSTPPGDCCGQWSEDGKYFVFQSMRDGNTGIWIMREPGGLFSWSKSAPVRLTTGPMETSAPLPIGDGRRIFVIGAKHRGEFVRYDSRTHQFVRFLEGISASSVKFSKDGHAILYVGFPESTLWRAKQDGSERVQLTSTGLEVMFANWSPDGKLIALCGRVPNSPWKIYVLPAEGGEPKPVTTERLNEGDPSWSPDGKSLAFGRLPWITGNQETAEIYTLDVNSGRVMTLPGSQGLFAPHWSPDGKMLLAARADSTAFLLFDFERRNWTTLATGLLGFPAWARDSNYVYALDGHVSQKSAFVRIRVSDGKVENVADLSSLRQAVFPWVGLGPGDVPIAVRDVGTEEIYALELGAR